MNTPLPCMCKKTQLPQRKSLKPLMLKSRLRKLVFMSSMTALAKGVCAMEALDISALYHAALEETDGTGDLDGRRCMRLTTISRLGMSWKPCECRSDIAQPAVRQLELQELQRP